MHCCTQKNGIAGEWTMCFGSRRSGAEEDALSSREGDIICPTFDRDEDEDEDEKRGGREKDKENKRIVTI